MKITREKHMASITRLMPFLLLALILQCLIYMQWAPFARALDVSIFVGIGLSLCAASFAFYDHFHTVQLYRHHLLIKFGPMNYKEEILYKHIQHLDIQVSKHAYYNVTLTMKDGTGHKLYYLEDVQELKALIRQT